MLYLYRVRLTNVLTASWNTPTVKSVKPNFFNCVIMPYMKQLVDIKLVIPNPNNPRTIKDDNFKKLVNSVISFPKMLEKRPIVVDENMIVLGGNMRLKACKEAKLKEVWIDNTEDWTDEEKRQFIIKDNVSGGEWDWDMLANQYEPAELDEWGLDLPDKSILEPEIEEDEAPEVSSEPPVSQLGVVYQLGRHRVMCGDSTDFGAISDLMNGKIADLMFTDPPYRMEAEGGSNQWVGKSAAKLGETIKELTNFEPKYFLDTKDAYFNKSVNMYIFCNKDLIPDYLNWVLENKLGFNLLVWKKPNALPLGGQHRPDIEYIIKVHKSAIWNNGLKNVNYSKCLEYGRDNSTFHPTMKPLELIANELYISSNKDSIVVDPFLGSGSTLIACEQTDRTCYGMELDPKYVDVIRKRYAKYCYPDTWKERWEELTPEISEGTVNYGS